MKQQTRRSLMVGALLGAIALAWWLGRAPPAAAIAAVPPRSPAAAPATARVLEELAVFLRDYEAARAAPPEAALRGPVRDLFALPESAVPPAPPPTSQPEVLPETPGPQRLEGVILGPNPMARIDGRLWSLRQSVDGWTLSQIERESVLLRDERRGTVLRLQLPPAWERQRR